MQKSVEEDDWYGVHIFPVGKVDVVPIQTVVDEATYIEEEEA